MTGRFIAESLLGAFAVASGLWLLTAETPPAKKNRRVVGGILQVVVGVFLIALSVSEI